MADRLRLAGGAGGEDDQRRVVAARGRRRGRGRRRTATRRGRESASRRRAKPASPAHASSSVALVGHDHAPARPASDPRAQVGRRAAARCRAARRRRSASRRPSRRPTRAGCRSRVITTSPRCDAARGERARKPRRAVGDLAEADAPSARRRRSIATSARPRRIGGVDDVAREVHGARYVHHQRHPGLPATEAGQYPDSRIGASCRVCRSTGEVPPRDVLACRARRIHEVVERGNQGGTATGANLLVGERASSFSASPSANPVGVRKSFAPTPQTLGSCARSRPAWPATVALPAAGASAQTTAASGGGGAAYVPPPPPGQGRRSSTAIAIPPAGAPAAASRRSSPPPTGSSSKPYVYGGGHKPYSQIWRKLDRGYDCSGTVSLRALRRQVARAARSTPPAS